MVWRKGLDQFEGLLIIHFIEVVKLDIGIFAGLPLDKYAGNIMLNCDPDHIRDVGRIAL